MAFSAGNGMGGGRSVGGRRSVAVGTLSEINVVPLVDVVLVLLIIFMLTAQVMEFGLEIKVPQVKEVKETVEDLPVVQISRDGKHVPERQAGQHQPARPGDRRRRFKEQKSVYVRADKAGVCGTRSVQVMPR